MRPLLLCAALVTVCAAAGADSLKDGAISVTPGMWNWKQETSVVGVPIKEENLECLIPERATIKLSKLAYDLDEGCTVDNVIPTNDGYSFKLICKGKTEGKADATLSHNDKLMSIRAKGSAKVLGIPAGFSMKADATYVGDCTPAEAQRQKEKWLAEQAAEKN